MNINETLIYRNDVVLIVDDRQSRIAWRVGRVTELIKGRDNVVRAAKVSSKTDQGRLKLHLHLIDFWQPPEKMI